MRCQHINILPNVLLLSGSERALISRIRRQCFSTQHFSLPTAARYPTHSSHSSKSLRLYSNVLNNMQVSSVCYEACKDGWQVTDRLLRARPRDRSNQRIVGQYWPRLCLDRISRVIARTTWSIKVASKPEPGFCWHFGPSGIRRY